MASKDERASLTPKLISLAVAGCFSGAAYAQVLPTGPHSMSGIAGINTVNSTMTVTTNANRSIVNWQTFSIGSGATVDIQQLGASSAILNRVTGVNGRIDPSSILGTLQSNGRVFLINPSGIVFGAGSRIDVAGLVASSLNLSDTDFLGGRLRFTEIPGAGSVVNEGAINAATGGQVYLVGPSVTNSGIITSPKGEVILAAGNSVELVNPGTPNLRVEITAPSNEAKNLGAIVAEAGRVGIYAGLITHSGTTRADSAVATEDGRIVLRATRNATVEAGSVISASGPAGGQVTIQSGDTTVVSGTVSATGSAGKGGTVQVLGNLVGLDGNASIDVSGETGGGTALVGGDFQGKNPDVQNASRTYFGPNAKISANAIGNGDGGTVVVWSDEVTGAYGTVSARGGKDSGNGGFVEVSSKGWLDFHAKVDTSAPKGRTGTLLLDPVNVCVEDGFSGACGSGGTGSSIPSASGGMASVFTSSGGVLSVLQWSSGGAGSIYDVMRTNNVVVTTSGPGSEAGNIGIVQDSPDLISDNSLVFVAHNNVDINGRIVNTGQGELRVHAGWNEAATPVSSLASDPLGPVVLNPGVGNITVNSNIDMHGNVLMRSGNDINVNARITAGSFSSPSDRTLTLDAGNRLAITSDLQVFAGPGVTATLALLGGAGGIDLAGGPGITFSVEGGLGCCGDIGGSAAVSMSTPGPVSISNAVFDISGGEGGGGTPGAAGGSATFTMTAGGPATISSSSIFVNGGRGGRGDGAEGFGAVGGMGGNAAITISAPSVSLTSSGLTVRGGNGGAGGSASFFGGTGGRGGDASLTLSGGAFSISGMSVIDVTGGSGGFGGIASGTGGTGGRGGDAIFNAMLGSLAMDTSVILVTGGRGGDGAEGFALGGGVGGTGGNGLFSMSGGPVTLTSGSSINVWGGQGGNGGSAISSGRGGDGGNGGSANLTMNVASVSLTGSSIAVRGGQGNDGGFGSEGADGGKGGDGGSASLFINSTVAGNAIALDGSFIVVEGGRGGRGGFAESTGDGFTGTPGAGGNGGNATGILTATNVSLTGSGFNVRAGGPGGGGGADDSDVGPVGQSGNATAIVNAGGNVTLQTSSGISAERGLGAEGQSGGGNASVTVAADGSVMVVSGSTIWAVGGDNFLGPAGRADVALLGGGGVVIDDSVGVGAMGGFNPSRGGDATLTIFAEGPISISDSNLLGERSGIFAMGGGTSPFFGTAFEGGSAGVLIVSLSGVTITGSAVGAIGGSASTIGGSGVTQITTLGDLLIAGTPGAFDSAVVAVGGSVDGSGGIGGTGQLNLGASGTTSISNSAVVAMGGKAPLGTGGDAVFDVESPSFLVVTSSVGAFGGMGGTQGNAIVTVFSDNIRVEGTDPPTGSLGDYLLNIEPWVGPVSSESPGLGESTTLIAAGGAASVGLTIGGPDGELVLDNDTIEANAAGGGSSDISVDFTERTSGGITLIGRGGFVRNGSPVAILPKYRTPPPPSAPPTETTEEPPITFDSQQISSLNSLAELLSPETQNQADPAAPEKDDKKKKQAECR